MKQNKMTAAISVVLVFEAFLLLCCIAVAQSNKVKGVINARSGATMTVQTQDSGNVIVVLTPATQVEEPEGVFRKKHLSMTSLVPGLAVEVKGAFTPQNQLVADHATFHGSDLQTAQDIQAGLTPTEQQVQQSQKQIQAQQQEIRQQQQQLQAQQRESAEHAAAIAANKAAIAAAIAAANKRFGELADYNILGEQTVLFGNDKVSLEGQYKPQLLQLAQQGEIPLTNMLAPGAMGTSRQVAADSTAEGQADNRRVVVRILQNKGIAGT